MTIKKSLSEVISLRKENLRLREEILRLKVKEEVKMDEQSSKNRDILFSVSITALLAVVAYTFNFFFDEILSYKVSVEVSNLQLCYVTQSPDSDMIKFYILLGSIIGIGAISSYLWRRK
ncbi:MAG: hypothetical protein SPL83_07775 [Succinivibrio sp.]|nr:hypothetical protein [Succinivibrio sp.]PWM81126.1 MAG: hypothetical protein DBY31_06680 [Succinivibrio sp.]